MSANSSGMTYWSVAVKLDTYGMCHEGSVASDEGRAWGCCGGLGYPLLPVHTPGDSFSKFKVTHTHTPRRLPALLVVTMDENVTPRGWCELLVTKVI